jgi:hypothetical protein
MADRNKFEEMLERLVNEDREGAEELFHEIVVEKSRDIYEGLLESDLEDEEVDEATDEEVDESDDEEVEENFDLDEFEVEADDDMGGDPADDMMADIEAGDDEGDDEEGDEGDMEDRVEDLEDALDELKAEFEKMMGGEDEGEDEGEDDADMDAEEEPEEESFAFEADDEEVEETADEEVEETAKSATEQMREYVEKVAGGHGAETKGKPESADNKKSTVASKNDMGGTASNLNQGKEGAEGDHAGLGDSNAKDETAGNVNVPGGKAGKSLKANGKGHGAEKKGAGETADNKKSVV